MTTQVRPDALKRIRAFFATEQAMAEAFAVTQPTVWRWLNHPIKFRPNMSFGPKN
jgi:DNA invertase Pin-like site-specific DNA recombinase